MAKKAHRPKPSGPSPRLIDLRRQLRVYIARHDLNQRTFAQKIGVRQAHLSNVMRGRSHASLALAFAVEDLTGIPARLFAWDRKAS